MDRYSMSDLTRKAQPLYIVNLKRMAFLVDTTPPVGSITANTEVLLLRFFISFQQMQLQALTQTLKIRKRTKPYCVHLN